MKPLPALALALLLGGCGTAPDSVRAPESVGAAGGVAPSPTTRDVEGCPVTVPPQPGFVPPEPYPAEPFPPQASAQVWYGTPELWTTLESDGAVWRDLPVGKGRHAIGDKTLWFSESFSRAEDEDFSGDAGITLTAVDLDGSARKVVVQGGAPSFNHHLKNFILVGLGLPEPGCWELTARYGEAELSYVFFVEG